MPKIGRVLYRARGVIGFIAFFILFCLSNPSNKTIFYSIPSILIGLILRFWASIYIGKMARTKTITIERIITEGPYRYFSHPLYLGNFFLTLGVLIALSPPLFFSLLTIILFIIEYGLIIQAETVAKRVFSKSSAQTAGTTRRFKLERETLLYLLLIYLLIIYRIKS